MGNQRIGRPSDKLGVIVVDENLCHANAARRLLVKLDFQVLVYTSPVEALKFLKDHIKDIDFALVAVNMKEMHGFQFLDISRKSHKNLQVIMMSVDLTWPTVKRSVELGARFLVKKPLDANTINNIWQHLDLKFYWREKIEYLFQGIEPKNDDVFESENKFGEGKRKVAHLMWTPFLQKKFLQALELLGEAATPRKVQLIMNVNSIGRKQISAHLQKHRKKVEKELRNTDAKKCSNDPEIQPANISDEEMSWDETGNTQETQGKTMYEAMRRALKLGTVFDESQLPNDPFGRQASKGEVDMTGDGYGRDDWTYAFGGNSVVSETQNAENAKGVMGTKCDSDKQVPNGDAQAQVMKLVTYSDSEDGEAF
ncbi:hypothetical protein PAHAL_7G110000 [Panicum hallii]|uniref:Response regulatory domain-containing protein n=1 Tax=Panicum hallii TaxID=206008 RepID=A0A2T8IBS7_9POAL|nr:two-component response regulator ORR29-like [Panicum hallii]PVH35125.1 hypothetical protein PAHAL_7G110000 [Panicum hallii]